MSTLLFGALVLSLLMILLSASADMYKITFLILIDVSVGFYFYNTLYRKSGSILPLEIGSLYLAIAIFYSIYPLLIFLLGGMQYTLLSDNRLWALQPSANQVFVVGCYYLLFLVSFSVAYIYFRRPGAINRTISFRVSRSKLVVLLFLLCVVGAILFTIETTFSLSSSTYGEQYTVVYQLPLVVRQIYSHLNSMYLVFAVFVIVGLFSNYQRNKLLIFGLGCFFLIKSFLLGGSRTELFVILLASFVAYHYLEKPIKARDAFTSAFVLITLFLLMGFIRDIGEMSVGSMFFLRTNEFEALFANVMDLNDRRETGGISGVPFLYFIEGIVNVVPQQLLPFDKPGLSLWYVNTYYPEYAEMGGGLAFGIIAEAMLENPVMGVVWRAVMLGGGFAVLHNFLLRRKITFYSLATYVWVFVFSYLMFRDTAFTLFSRFFLDFIPALLTVILLFKVAKKE